MVLQPHPPFRLTEVPESLCFTLSVTSRFSVHMPFSGLQQLTIAKTAVTSGLHSASSSSLGGPQEWGVYFRWKHRLLFLFLVYLFLCSASLANLSFIFVLCDNSNILDFPLHWTSAGEVLTGKSVQIYQKELKKHFHPILSHLFFCWGVWSSSAGVSTLDCKPRGQSLNSYQGRNLFSDFFFSCVHYPTDLLWVHALTIQC